MTSEHNFQITREGYTFPVIVIFKGSRSLDIHEPNEWLLEEYAIDADGKKWVLTNEEMNEADKMHP